MESLAFSPPFPYKSVAGIHEVSGGNFIDQNARFEHFIEWKNLNQPTWELNL